MAHEATDMLTRGSLLDHRWPSWLELRADRGVAPSVTARCNVDRLLCTIQGTGKAIDRLSAATSRAGIWEARSQHASLPWLQLGCWRYM